MGNKQSKKQMNSSNSNSNSNSKEKTQIGQQIQYSSNNSTSTSSKKITKLNRKQGDDKKKTIAVIVTFSSCGSYDGLFQSIEQKSQEGTKVSVYKCQVSALDCILDAFKQKYQNQQLKQMIMEIHSVDKDCVVFNWECCSHYSGQQFTEGTQLLFKFLKKMIDQGYMCMFSDFSLKALVKNWNEKVLGPNPFQKVGQTSQVVQLRFKSGQLKECPSAQLQTVGQMAEQGKVNVHTMGGTIVYSVNKKNLNHDKYKLTVLTVAANIKAENDNLTCQKGEFKGTAGHVLVKYPSGGSILTSMTHWIQLMKVDTSEQKLFEVAAREYGQVYAQQQKMAYDSLAQVQKVSWRANKATQFIQNQAPCTNMSKKARY